MKSLSFSKMELAERCAAFAALPWSHRNSEDATAGSAKHDYLATAPTAGRERALQLVPEEHRAACARIDLLPTPAARPESYAYEVSYAINVDTGEARELGRGLQRRYDQAAQPPGEREIAGTLDVVGLTDDLVIYPDYKSGWGEVTPPRENWQLRIGALAAARAYGRDRAMVAIIHLRNGEPRWDVANLSELDLDATEHAIRRVVARVERAQEQVAKGESPTTYEGDWCGYCPALPHCPAMMRLATALGTADGEVVPPVLNAETAPLFYHRVKAAELVLERVKLSLEEWARVSPIPLGNGWVYGQKQLPRTVIDPVKAPPVLLERMGLRVEPESKLSLTKEGLMDQLIPQLQAGQRKTKVLAKAMEVLKESGAATVSYSNPVMKHRKAALPSGAEPKATQTAPGAEEQDDAP